MSLPRITSRTPLQEPTILPSHHSPPVSPTIMAFPISHFLAALNPRKPRHRTTFFALIALVCLSTYVFFVQHPSFSPALPLRHTDSNGASQMALALESIRNSRFGAKGGPKHKWSTSHTHRTQVRLDGAQELAAISSFLASLPQNSLPSTIDPSVPIDPQLVLDFDTRGPRAAVEVQAMVEEVWQRNPVFLYAKHYSSSSREVKNIIASMHLHPAPTIIDVDTRDDAEVLKATITRLTSSAELPVLLVGGRSVGSVANILALDKSGDLRKLIAASGAVIEGAKKKKHRK
ncbi:hypothetical protein BD779DRAFT_1467838 [Infundibulicybe gibba]|nr:hypothetical protein BD779DRAFT_1467838 [Infundibulicybe gibba]